MNHVDGHQFIGYTLDDVRAGDTVWFAADGIHVTRPADAIVAEVIPERPAA